MTDPTSEWLGGLFPLCELPNHLPPGPGGRKPHSSLGFRWANQGVAGVRLPVKRVGKTLYTSLADVEEFVRQVTAARSVDVARGDVALPGSVDVEGRLDVELGRGAE